MASLVKIISTEIDSVKRRIGKFLRLGNHDYQTAMEFGPYGVDSNPIKDMVAIYTETGTKGKTAIFGYLNKNQLADVGEFRIFSTDNNGAQKTYVWLKSDGSIEVGGASDHMVRYSKLEEAFNQLKSDFNEFVTTKYNTHIHDVPQSPAGINPSAQTTSAGSSSSADITGAKIDQIKTIGS